MRALHIIGVLLIVSSAGRAQTAVDTERVYSEEQLPVVPVVMRQPAVAYPDSLRRASIGGTVRVSVIVDRKGHPDSTSVHVVSSPDTGLNAAARAVVLGSKFTAGHIEDRDVRTLLTVGVVFDPLDTTTAPSPIYGRGELTEAPVLLSGPPLDYPEDLRRSQIQGTVLVQMILDTLGHVEPESIQFMKLPDPGFMLPVSQYLKFARFRPARRDGHPVRSCVYLPINFRLHGMPGPTCIIPGFRNGCRP